ncbi:MAG: hypothetical protein ACTSQJ_08765 [Promethearchaeota archaeon]
METLGSPEEITRSDYFSQSIISIILSSFAFIALIISGMTGAATIYGKGGVTSKPHVSTAVKAIYGIFVGSLWLFWILNL